MNLKCEKNKISQNTPEWLQLRKNYIGASDAPVIMGVAKFKLNDGRVKTPYLLWKEKLGLEHIHIDNSAVRYGLSHEEEIRASFSDSMDVTLLSAIRFSSEYEFMMASLDGISQDGSIAVEIKCANKEDHECAQQNKIPAHYFPQIQHQLVVTALPFMYYVSYHKGDIASVKVFRDEIYISSLIEKEKAFWDCVMNLKAPQLNPDDFVEQDYEFELLADNLWSLKRSISTLKEEIKLLEKDADHYEELLIKKCHGHNSRSKSYQFEFRTRKGNIDYKAAFEIAQVDLEKYRKPPVQIPTLLRISKEPSESA